MDYNKVELPFEDFFLQYRNSVSESEKIQIFKNWLESYIKFNLGIHVSWILKNQTDNIPVNLRVLLVQLFQKPPSIGSCFSVSKFINKELLSKADIKTVFAKYANWFDKNESLFSKLIELRNKDAHSASSMNEKDLMEIENILQILLSNPILSNGILIISTNYELIKSKLEIPNGIEKLNIPLVLFKEGIFLHSDKIRLNGNELVLFPFVCAVKLDEESAINKSVVKLFADLDRELIANNIDESSTSSEFYEIDPFKQWYELVFWNKRVSNKGLYSCYLNKTIQDLEISNITDLSGFPYDDWKRSTNPLFLKYLESKNKVVDEMLYDESVEVNTWFDEYLVAKRLESDIDLEHYEKITLREYVSGLLHKLKKVKDTDILVSYYKRISSIENELENESEIERPYLVQEIINSRVFLFKNSVELNDIENYNKHYNSVINFLPFYFYQGLHPAIPLIDMIGGVERMARMDKKKIFQRNLFYVGNLVFVLLMIFIFRQWLLFTSLTLLLILDYVVIKNLRRFTNFNMIYSSHKTKSYLENHIHYVLGYLASGGEGLHIYSNSKNIELSEVFALSVLEEKIDFNNRSFAQKVLFALLTERSDFLKIGLRRNFLKYILTTESNLVLGSSKEVVLEQLGISMAIRLGANDTILVYKTSGDLSEYDLSYEDRIRFIKDDIQSNSIIQKAYTIHMLNKVIYYENIVKCYHMINNNVRYSLKTRLIGDRRYRTTHHMFSDRFCEGSYSHDLDFRDYNYLLAFLSAYLGDLDDALSFFISANEVSNSKWELFTLWNIAQIYGAQRQTMKCFEVYLIIDKKMKLLNSDQRNILGNWVEDDIRVVIEKINIELNKIDSNVNEPQIAFDSMPVVKNKFSLAFAPNELPSEMKYIKLIP